VIRTIGIVTARGGSKGIPYKNVAPLLGRPLLAYTADAALAARSLQRTILSTDDPQIAEVGRACGLDVPFLRPAELAGDATASLPVLRHAVEWLERQGEFYEAVCLLQPTNPLRTADTIDACIDLLERAQADSVVTVLTVPNDYNPNWVYQKRADGTLKLFTGEANPIPRRQDLPPAYHREGSVYVTRRDVLMEQNSLFGNRVVGYSMDGLPCVNIDEASDLERAAELLAAALRRASGSIRQIAVG
jgi:CMP-N-acetylneuraminic acid synthetase